MKEFTLVVPTYNAMLFPRLVAVGNKPEFGDPAAPVVIQESQGVRIVLGTRDVDDLKKPDLQIERHPFGWMIFLRPVGGSDASGFVFFLDDGRSFVKPEVCAGPTRSIELLATEQAVPGFNEM